MRLWRLLMLAAGRPIRCQTCRKQGRRIKVTVYTVVAHCEVAHSDR